jgi:hypothetical protein
MRTEKELLGGGMGQDRITYRTTPAADLILQSLGKYELEAAAICAWHPELHRKYTPTWKPQINHTAKEFWANFEKLGGDSDQWGELTHKAFFSELPITPDPVLFPDAYVSLDSDLNVIELPSLFSSDILTDAVEHCDFLKTYYRATERFLTDPSLEAVHWRTL